MVFVERTVEAIGAALRHKVDLRSGRTAGSSVVVAGGHAEFLQGVERGAHGAFERVPLQLVVVVETIECDVGLVASRPVDRTAAAVIVLLGIGCLSDINDSGLETQ